MSLEDAYYRMIYLLENDAMHLDDDIGTDNPKILERRKESKISMERLIEIIEEMKDEILYKENMGDK